MKQLKQTWEIEDFDSEVESTIDIDAFNWSDWLRANDLNPRLEFETDQAASDFVGNPIQDMFWEFYNSSPEFRETLPTGLAPLKKLIEQALDTPNFANLKEVTKGDLFTSAMAAPAFTRQTLAALSQELKDQAQEAAEAERNAEDARETSDAMDQMLDQMMQDGNFDPKNNEAQAEFERACAAAGEAADQAEANAQAVAHEVSEAMEAEGPTIKAAINQAAEEATEEAENNQAFAQGFGLAAGTKERITPEVAAAAKQALDKLPNLDNLADLLGWAMNVAKAEMRNAPKSRQKPVGFRAQEIDFATMTEDEQMAGTGGYGKAAQDDWSLRASEDAIIHVKKEGKEKQGRGPIVIVRDTSGSMSGKNHQMALALEWALLMVARRQNRDFVSIPFSGSGQYHVWEAPKVGQPDPQGLLDHLTTFYGGGTEIYGPLKEASDRIQGSNLEADILFLTDAYVWETDYAKGFYASLEQARQSTGDQLKVVTALVMDTGQQDLTAVEKFSDVIFSIPDMMRNKDKIREVMREIIRDN